MPLLSSELVLHTGEKVFLRDLVKTGPIALVFLRHFGCIFCKQQIAKLKELGDDLNVAFVVMSDVERAASFREQLGVVHPLVCDVEMTLHDKFGVPRGNVNQLANAKVMRRAIGAMFQGYKPGLPVGDARMLSAEFILDQEGTIRWKHVADDISDLASADTVREKLEEAKLSSSSS